MAEEKGAEQTTPESGIKFNVGAYSERQRKEAGSEEIPIKNLDKRFIKKGPDAGIKGR